MSKSGTGRDLLHWKCWSKARLGISFIEKTKIRNDWDLFYWKGRQKVRLGIYFIEKTKVRYGWDLFYWKKVEVRKPLKIYFIDKVKVRLEKAKIESHWKGQNNARLEFCFIEHEKVRYDCGFISLKILKYSTAEDFFHSKGWKKVRLWIYFNKKIQNKAQLGI